MEKFCGKNHSRDKMCLNSQLCHFCRIITPTTTQQSKTKIRRNILPPSPRTSTWKWRQCAPPARLHGVITQDTMIWSFTTMRTYNFTQDKNIPHKMYACLNIPLHKFHVTSQSFCVPNILYSLCVIDSLFYLKKIRTKIIIVFQTSITKIQDTMMSLIP
jgi:hypothetical protein